MEGLCCFGSTQEEHDERLDSLLKRLEEYGVTLNPEKCVISATSLKYLGCIIDQSGFRSDPAKVEAITNFPAPQNVTEVRRFLGMVNQLAKFIPKMAEISKPIRLLLNKDSEWYWGADQIGSFARIKDILKSPEVLLHYNKDAPIRLYADECRDGISSILMQEKDNNWRPVSYASRSLNDAEKNYAVIELEALAITWGCEKFSQYLIGKEFTVLSDHKSLINLLNKKRLDELPARLQRFRIRLLRFNYTVKYIPGKNQEAADALSRSTNNSENCELNFIANEFSSALIKTLPVSQVKLEEIIKEKCNDRILSQVRQYVTTHWPGEVSGELKPYFALRAELNIVDNVLLRGVRIVIPPKFQKDIVNRIHEGHLGVTKCLDRARSCVFWPGISAHIRDKVSNCETCTRMRTNRHEPLIPTEFPGRPWEKVGTDLFHFQGKNYLLIVDYYSRWVEIAYLPSTSAQSVINAMKSIFARYGVPEECVMDGGPCYAAYEFKSFAKSYGFKATTSSPYYPMGNGEAERSVQTVKGLLKKAKSSGQCPYLALLSYRSTPLRNGYSPAQLFMNRNIRALIPVSSGFLSPAQPTKDKVCHFEKNYRNSYKSYHDRKQGARKLPDLSPGQVVVMKNDKTKYKVVSIDYNPSPRKYVIKGEGEGVYIRNRRHLVPLGGRLPSIPEESDEEFLGFEPQPVAAQTQSSQPPSRTTQAQVSDAEGTASRNAQAQVSEAEEQAHLRREDRSTRGVKPIRYRS